MSFFARPEPGKKISPLALRKALTGPGSLQHCTLRRDGQFMVTFGETTVNPFPEKLRVDDICIQLVSAPTATVRGTIFSPELVGCSPSALKEENTEPVTTVTRFSKENSGRFLTPFLGKELAESVKLSCGLILSVKPHVTVPRTATMRTAVLPPLAVPSAVYQSTSETAPRPRSALHVGNHIWSRPLNATRIGQLEELILQQAAKTDSLVAAMQWQSEIMEKIFA